MIIEPGEPLAPEEVDVFVEPELLVELDEAVGTVYASSVEGALSALLVLKAVAAK
jgi:hypothetical protein